MEPDPIAPPTPPFEFSSAPAFREGEAPAEPLMPDSAHLGSGSAGASTSRQTRTLVNYRCPGETDDISVGVHLSRLSSFYHKCRLCEHRSDIARLAPVQQKQWQQLLLAPEPPKLFQTNGVRGLYLNQLTRNEASQVAAAFAATLREFVEIWRSRHPAPPSRWLKVVFGHDSRPSSPDLAIAAATTLRQQGCEVLDLGWSVLPQVEAVLRESGADGAFFVTGHGASVGWNGFDLIGPDGVIWSQGGVLDLVEQRFHQSIPRPEREAAPHTIRDATEQTLAMLRAELHGLRPLCVSVETAEPTLLSLLIVSRPDWPGTALLRREGEALAAPLPRMTPTGGNGSAGASPSQHVPPDILFRIGEDARQCEMFDEAGQKVTGTRILFGLGELLLHEHPHVDVVLSDTMFDSVGWTVERCGPGFLVFHRGGLTEEHLVRTMHSLNSPLGLDGEGRFWIRREGQVRCDGLLSMAMILRSLSRTDALASGWCTTPL